MTLPLHCACNVGTGSAMQDRKPIEPFCTYRPCGEGAGAAEEAPRTQGIPFASTIRTAGAALLTCRVATGLVWARAGAACRRPGSWRGGRAVLAGRRTGHRFTLPGARCQSRPPTAAALWQVQRLLASSRMRPSLRPSLERVELNRECHRLRDPSAETLTMSCQPRALRVVSEECVVPSLRRLHLCRPSCTSL